MTEGRKSLTVLVADDDEDDRRFIAKAWGKSRLANDLRFVNQIPIIILTTSQADEDICRSNDLGANSYIAKPVTFGALVDVLQVLGNYWIDIVNLPLESTGAYGG